MNHMRPWMQKTFPASVRRFRPAPGPLSLADPRQPCLLAAKVLLFIRSKGKYTIHAGIFDLCIAQWPDSH